MIIEFLDRGYGLITLTPGLPATRQWSVARVNTGRVRRAVFQYDQAPPRQIRVEGLDYLRGVTLTDQEPVFEPTPMVEPAVRFAVPSERVTTATSDAANPDLVAEVIAGLRNNLPLVRAIGFNGIETCVRWGLVERKPGSYDWSYKFRQGHTHIGYWAGDNFTITRMASSAARFYGIPLGYEPGGFGSKRGVMARLFNAVTIVEHLRVVPVVGLARISQTARPF